MKKREISIFLIILIISISLNSSIIFSQENNPAIREETILSKCTVNAYSDQDNIKVTLRTSKSENVLIYLYDEKVIPEIGNLRLIAITKVSDDNIYRFNYQGKEYATDQIILKDVCYIDESNKEQTSQETAQEACRQITLTAGCSLWVSSYRCRCIDENPPDSSITPYSNPPNYYELTPDDRGNCPDTHTWTVQLPLNCGTVCTPNWQCNDWSACSNSRQARTCTDSNNCGTTDGKPPETRGCQSPTLQATCEDNKDYTSCINSNLGCQWVSQDVSQATPLDCSSDPIKQILGAIGSVLYSILSAIFSVFAAIFGIFGMKINIPPAGHSDCSQYNNFQSVQHCIPIPKTTITDSDANADHLNGNSPRYPGNFIDSQGKLWQDKCQNDGLHLDEAYIDDNGKPATKTYNCQDFGMTCGTNEEGLGACYKVDPNDLKKYNEIIGKYNKIIERMVYLETLKPGDYQPIIDPVTQRQIGFVGTGTNAMEIQQTIQSENIPARLLEIRDYFQSYYDKQKDQEIKTKTKMMIAKINAMLATFEVLMPVKPDQINNDNVFTYYRASHDAFTEVYSALPAIDQMTNSQRIMASDALTSRAILDLKAPEIFRTDVFVNPNDEAPRIEQILHSLSDAKNLDPTNVRAAKILSYLRLSILKSINARLDVEIEQLKNPLKAKYNIDPTQVDYANSYGARLGAIVEAPIALARSYAGYDNFEKMLGTYFSRGFEQKGGILFMETLEQVGGDVSVYYSLTSFDEKKNYIKKLFNYADDQVATTVVNTIDSILGSASPLGNNLNPDALLLAENGQLTPDQLEVYRNLEKNGNTQDMQYDPNPHFRFLEGKGYLIPEYLQPDKYDSLAKNLNLIDVVLLGSLGFSAIEVLFSGAIRMVGMLATIRRANAIESLLNAAGKAEAWDFGKIVDLSEQITPNVAARIGIGAKNPLVRLELNNPTLQASIGRYLDFSPDRSAKYVWNIIDEMKNKEIAKILMEETRRYGMTQTVAQKIAREISLTSETPVSQQIMNRLTAYDLIEPEMSLNARELMVQERFRKSIEITEEKIVERISSLAEKEYANIKNTALEADTVVWEDAKDAKLGEDLRDAFDNYEFIPTFGAREIGAAENVLPPGENFNFVPRTSGVAIEPEYSSAQVVEDATTAIDMIKSNQGKSIYINVKTLSQANEIIDEYLRSQNLMQEARSIVTYQDNALIEAGRLTGSDADAYLNRVDAILTEHGLEEEIYSISVGQYTTQQGTISQKVLIRYDIYEGLGLNPGELPHVNLKSSNGDNVHLIFETLF